ncbi:MAG: MerC domain-containing protein [Planctomycetota bacterium]
MTTLTPSVPAAALDDGRPPTSRLDQLGIVASVACVVHCLATPVLLILMPVMGAWWSHPAAHWGLAALVLPLALWVVLRGYRRHRRRAALVAAVLGAVFIVAGLVLPEIDGPAPLSLELPALFAAEANPHGDAAPAAFPGDHGQGHGETACTDTCCPTVAYDAAAGQASLTLPPGTLVTLLGSVFLVTAHAVNLYGCRCLRRSTTASSTGSCGCPEA